MDLIAQNFAASALLKNFPAFETLEYKGEAAPGIQLYRGTRTGEEKFLAAAHLIRREEADVWKACSEMLGRTLKESAAAMQGFFGFDLLSVDLEDQMRNFQWGNFSQLLLNHSRKMQTGEARLIPYASITGIFKKRMPETWGKIDFYSPVKVFNDEPSKLDLFIKKMLKIQASDYLIRDLSLEPVFRFGEEEQTARLAKLFEKTKPLPEIYYGTRDHWIELGAQFGVRS